MANSARSYYRLTFPEGLEQEAVESFVTVMGGLPTDVPSEHAAIVFEVWGDRAGVHHRIGIPTMQSHLIDQLRTHTHGLHADQEEGSPLADFHSAQEYGLTSDIVPLMIKNPAAVARTILTSLQPLQPHEVAAIQWIITPTKQKPPKIRQVRPVLMNAQSGYARNLPGFGYEAIEGVGAKVNNLLQENISNWYNQKQVEKEAYASEKWQGAMFSAICRIAVRSDTNPDQLHYRVLQALTSTSHMVRFKPKSYGSNERIVSWFQNGTVPSFQWPCLLNQAELSALLAFPLESPHIVGMQLGGSYQAPPAPSIPEEGRIVAFSDYSGSERPLAIPWKETLRHVYALGPTGSGKTTLLENCAIQDMQHGAGVIYIDPKGDSALRLLDAVPAGREQDVIYFDPTNKYKVVGLNLLVNSTENPDLVASNFVSMFKKLYADSWGARMETILLGAVHTIAAVPDMTLLEIGELLTNDKFRKVILGQYPLPLALQHFWKDFEALSSNTREERIQPIINKVQHFSLRPTVRHVVGQVHTALDMQKVLSSRSIVIVNLDAGKIGDDNAQLLGSLFMLAFWQAVQNRPLGDRQKEVFCYVDEFQKFMHLPSPLGDILAQARGFGVGLFLASQHIYQVDTETRHDVLANTNSAIYFKLAAEDAGIIAKQYPRMEPENFLSLGQNEVIVSVSTGGTIRANPAVGRTYPPAVATGSSTFIHENNLSKFAFNCADIDAEIEKRQLGFAKRPTVGSRPVDE